MRIYAHVMSEVLMLLPGLEKAYKVLCKRMNYVGFSKSTIYNAELVVLSLNTFMVRNGMLWGFFIRL